MHAIEIDNLTLAYNSRQVLNDFSAAIEPGEFIGVFGPNGSGKSSLLKALLGLLTPEIGAIKILGRPVSYGNKEIGYVPQVLPISKTGQLSAEAHIAASLNGFQWGLPLLNPQQRAEIQGTLALVNAEKYAHRPYTQLSGGERQRLLLAQALLNNPKILLLDEPLTSLDPRHQEALIELIHDIQRQQKVTVLFTAHDLNPLIGTMDRIIYLARGKGTIGTIPEVVTNEKLSWLYGMPMEVIHHKERLYVISSERGEISEDVAHHHHDCGNI